MRTSAWEVLHKPAETARKIEFQYVTSPNPALVTRRLATPMANTHARQKR
jgi:hypothetical protein